MNDQIKMGRSLWKEGVRSTGFHHFESKGSVRWSSRGPSLLGPAGSICVGFPVEVKLTR